MSARGARRAARMADAVRAPERPASPRTPAGPPSPVGGPAASLGARIPPPQLALTALGIATLIFLFPLLARGFPGTFDQFHLLMLCFGFAAVLAALPLNLLMGYAGQVSLGHAAFLGIGAFIGAAVAGNAGLPFGLALVAAGAAGGTVALVMGLPALRLRGLYLALVTLGFGLAMLQLIFLNPSITRAKAGLPFPRARAGTFVFGNNGDLLALVVVILVIVWLLDRNLVRTRVGRAFFALRESEEVASSFGIDVPRHKMYAFVIYGAFSGLAGAVLGQVVGLAQADSFTFETSLFYVVVVVIGGLGSRLGVAIAAFFLTVMPRFLLALRGWEVIVSPLLLTFAILKHPTGLGGTLRRLRQRRASRRFATEAVAADADAGVSAAITFPRPDRAPGALAPHPLEARSISVRFGGLHALDGVSIEVPPRAITGLIGPNGAGKTTLFNVCSGFVRPSAGRVILQGDDVTGDPPHRRAARGLGRTFQLGGLVKDLTVTENLLLAQHQAVPYGPVRALLHAPPVGRRERGVRDRARETLSALGFERFGDMPLGHLSHGQQRIVELACALLTGPAVLLLDEPSAGMSPAAAEALAEVLLRTKRELDQTILLIEHHIPFVTATCDTVFVLDAGRLLVHGPPSRVVRDPSVVAAYLGEGAA